MKKTDVVLSVLVGVAIGWFTAPRSGKESRENFKKNTQKTYNTLKNMTKEEFVSLLQSTLDNVKGQVINFDYEGASEEVKTKYYELIDRLEDLIDGVKNNERFQEISLRVKEEILNVLQDAKVWVKSVVSKDSDEFDYEDVIEDIENISIELE